MITTPETAFAKQPLTKSASANLLEASNCADFCTKSTTTQSQRKQKPPNSLTIACGGKKETQAMDGLDPNRAFPTKNVPFNVAKHCLYSVVLGSHAYGTNTATSDVDFRGIIVPPVKYFYGLDELTHVEDKIFDSKYYTLRRFVELAAGGNVEALEILFVAPRSVWMLQEPMSELLAHRGLFVTQHLAKTFGGLAFGQLADMEKRRDPALAYNTKNAAHAMRLYRMGAEVLRTGVLTVNRPDYVDLLEVRLGKYTRDEFVQTTSRNGRTVVTGGALLADIENFEAARKESTLPERCDRRTVNALLVHLHRNVPWLRE